MIVPSNRLLALVALVVTPALTLVSLGGPWLRYGTIGLALAFAFVLLDAVSSSERLRALRVDTETQVHAIVGRPFELGIRVHWVKRKATLILKFDVPAELENVRIPNPIQFDGNVTEVRVVVESALRNRGRAELVRLHAQTPSGLGFWLVRRSYDVNIVIQGYPDLKSDRRTLAMNQFSKQLGAMASRFVGHGRAFDRLRDYVPGDELDDVHWRATAKRRKLTTKLYQVERDQRIYVAVDQSRLSARPSPRDDSEASSPSSLLERYINTALILGQVAQLQGDQFGLLGFSDQVDSFTPAGNGPVHYRACREAILGFSVRRVNADYTELFSFFSNKVRRRSMLFLLTSVDDPALCEELVESARIIADRHLVVVAAVSPKGSVSLAQTAPITQSEEIFDRLYSHLVWKRERTTSRRLGQNGIRYLSMEHGSIVPSVVHCYARIKQGQNL